MLSGWQQRKAKTLVHLERDWRKNSWKISGSDWQSEEKRKNTMISKSDKLLILKCTKKYKLTRVILFGSSRKRKDANGIDIGVTGLAPESFFDFCWARYRDRSKPLDVVDLSKDCLFNRLVERYVVVLYGLSP